MFRKVRPHDLPRQIFIFMLIGTLICIGSVSYTYQQIALKINQNAANDSRERVQERLSSFQTQVRLFSKDYNNWTAVYEASMRGDIDFIANNYGITAIEGKIFDFVVFFGGPFSSPLSWVENGSRNPGGMLLSSETVSAVQKALRDRKEVRPSIDFFAFDGEHLVMVTASYLLPDSEQAVDSQAVRTASVALIGRRLLRSDLATIERSVGVNNLHIVLRKKNDHISIPLPGAKGQTIAELAWQPNRPGSTMVKQLAPVIAILSLAFAALAALATWLVYKNARHLVLREVESRYLARTDALMCLPNRLAFNEVIHQESSGAINEIALVMIDLDRLKQTNDVFGHAVGDHLLRSFAEKLALCKDAWTFVARLGGDEFCALIRGSGAVERAHALVSILDVRCAKPVDVQGETVPLDFSAGIAAHSAGDHIDETIRKADLALRRSKASIEDRIGIYDADMDLADKSALLLQQALRRALRVPNEFFIVYQPIVSATDHKARLFEALARWTSPVLGAVAPERFIRAAEEMGVISELGWILMDKIIRDLASDTDLHASINVSPLQMMKPDFVGELIRRLDLAGVANDRIQIELTEHVLVRNQREILDRIESIRNAGIKVALDDFGTGFSAISYLTATQFDSIKIDGSLVRSALESDDRANFFRSVVSLCRAVCNNVVVEGVENPLLQLQARNAGADAFQGYFFGRPVIFNEVSRSQPPSDTASTHSSFGANVKVLMNREPIGCYQEAAAS